MMKDDIKKSAAIQAKIKENFNPYYINTSYDKLHKFIFGNSSLTQSSRELEKSSLDRRQALSQSDFSAQPTNLAQDTRIANDSKTKGVETSTDSTPQDEFAIPTARFAQIFAVNATPQIVFLDKNGRVKYIFAGYTLKLEKMIDDIVVNPAPLGDYAQIDKALNELKKDIK